MVGVIFYEENLVEWMLLDTLSSHNRTRYVVSLAFLVPEVP